MTGYPTRKEYQVSESSNWSSLNPVPALGLLCVETGTGIIKVGDGITHYNDLSDITEPDNGKQYATRADFVADVAGGYAPAEGKVVSAGGVQYVREDGATEIADLPGWEPFGDVFGLHWGAKEDYDPATDSGTDDSAAFQAAMNWVATARAGIGGGVVYVDGHAVANGLNVPEGVVIKGKRPPASWVRGQTGPSAWPISYREGSKLVGSALIGPVVRIRQSGGSVEDLTIGSTAARRSAAIAFGEDINCGVYVAGHDAPSQLIVGVSTKNLIIRDQPADGEHWCGQLVSCSSEHVKAINCGRHNHIIDDGTLNQRTNKLRPGIIDFVHAGGANAGGHNMVVGHPSAGVSQPYRITIIQEEGFRSGNDPTQVYESTGSYLLGEQITVISSSASATGGTSSNMPTQDHAWSIGGKANSISGSRSINFVEEPILILQSPWESVIGGSSLKIDGMHCSTSYMPRPVNAVKHDGQIIDLWVDNIGGTFTGQPVDLDTLLGYAIVQFEGKFTLKNISMGTEQIEHTRAVAIPNGVRSGQITIQDDEVLTLDLLEPGGFATFGQIDFCGPTISSKGGIAAFRVGSNPYVEKRGGDLTVTTGVLTGTTGEDGDLTISADGDLLYIENRTGLFRTYGYTITSTVRLT